MTFTGIKDTDFLILNQLSDDELGKVCQVNKYARKLCKDETFWLNRIGKNIQYSVDKYFKIYSKYLKGLKRNVDTSLYIVHARNFFGFKTNIEFYKFLKNLVGKFPALYFYVFAYSKGHKDLLDHIYTIDKNNLPNWINFDEFIFYLRRKILETFLKAVENKVISSSMPSIFDENISGFEKKHESFLISDHKLITELLNQI